MPTIKGLNQAILGFYGMGPPKRANAQVDARYQSAQVIAAYDVAGLKN